MRELFGELLAVNKKRQSMFFDRGRRFERQLAVPNEYRARDASLDRRWKVKLAMPKRKRRRVARQYQIADSRERAAKIRFVSSRLSELLIDGICISFRVWRGNIDCRFDGSNFQPGIKRRHRAFFNLHVFAPRIAKAPGGNRHRVSPSFQPFDLVTAIAVGDRSESLITGRPGDRNDRAHYHSAVWVGDLSFDSPSRAVGHDQRQCQKRERKRDDDEFKIYLLHRLETSLNWESRGLGESGNASDAGHYWLGGSASQAFYMR